jgi:hypothetical protein
MSADDDDDTTYREYLDRDGWWVSIIHTQRLLLRLLK